MGKHEREDIELMEKSVANCVNSEKPLIKAGDKWYEHMLGFVDYIKSKYSDIEKAEHIGNEYREDFGDIKLYRKNKVEFLELQASETAYSKGTLANISQNALTEYNLVLPSKEDRVLSWSEFREKNKFQNHAEKMLDKYCYPKKLTFEDKGRFLRDRAENGDQDAMGIRRGISAFAKLDKKGYVNYIRKFRTNEENLKTFIFCMLNGIHTKSEILKFFSDVSAEQLKEKYAYIATLYANVRAGKIYITKGENKVKLLLTDYKDFAFSFPSEDNEVVNTYITCSNKSTGMTSNLINLVYNWKNVFQGIQTPCINVFLGPFFD